MLYWEVNNLVAAVLLTLFISCISLHSAGSGKLTLDTLENHKKVFSSERHTCALINQGPGRAVSKIQVTCS